MEEKKVFKHCPMCQNEWKTRDAFLDDNTLKLNGYGVDFERLELGLFYFTHHVDGCHSTLAIQAGDFLNLYSGTQHSERRTGKEGCPGYCLQQDQLDRCEALCECAFNREVMQLIKSRQNGDQQ